MVKFYSSLLLVTLSALQLSLFNQFADGAIKVCERKEKGSNGCLIEVDDCLFLWSEGVSIAWGIEKGTDNYRETITSLDPKNLKVTGSCLAPSTNGTKGSLSLTLTNPVNATSISLDLQIVDRNVNGYWVIDEAQLEIQGHNTQKWQFRLKTKSVSAAEKFSYSCAKLQLVNYKENKTDDKYAVVTFTRFQFQPFLNDKTVFADSFDCSTWFTIPTWMGLLTVILFSFIISIGVFYLFDIKTMDRFENPKGKTISVPTTD